MATADQILSLAEVKQQLFIPAAETSQDTLLTSYRDAAVEHVASRAGRRLLDAELVLEVPVRYYPLSSAPFRVADLRSVDRVDYYSAGTQYFNDGVWNGDYFAQYAHYGGFYGGGGGYGYGASLAYPSQGLQVYRTEAETPPDLNSTQIRLERVGGGHSRNLWRVWPAVGEEWDNIHYYLPVRLTCQVGVAHADLPRVFKIACLIYVRFLWSQMPDFREGVTIDRIVAGHTELNVDAEAQRVIEVAA